MPRIYMTDTPRKSIALRNKIISASTKACACPVPPRSKEATTRDSSMARTTRVSTFYGAEFSSNRDGDSLDIYEEGQGVEQRRLIASFFGKAFYAEIEAQELSICLISSEVVPTSALGDRLDTKMTAARYQKTIIGKVRRLAGVSR
jgi:hypothetical protein